MYSGHSLKGRKCKSLTVETLLNCEMTNVWGTSGFCGEPQGFVGTAGPRAGPLLAGLGRARSPESPLSCSQVSNGGSLGPNTCIRSHTKWPSLGNYYNISTSVTCRLFLWRISIQSFFSPHNLVAFVVILLTIPPVLFLKLLIVLSLDSFLPSHLHKKGATNILLKVYYLLHYIPSKYILLFAKNMKCNTIIPFESILLLDVAAHYLKP